MKIVRKGGERMKIRNIKTEPVKNFRNLEFIASSRKNEFGLTSFAKWNLKDFCSNLGKMNEADFKTSTYQE